MSAQTVNLLPKEHTNPATWSSIIAKQKILRLRSLQIAPEAFSSTYEREAAFTDEEWEKRLQNSSASTFVAVKPPLHNYGGGESDSANSELADIVEGEWTGMGVLFGPLSDNNEKDVTTKQVRFEIFGLFVLPEARGFGVGKELVNEAVAHGKLIGKEKGADEVLVQVRAVPTNKSIVKLYDTLGFKTVEKEAEMESDGTVYMVLKVQT